MVTFVPFCNIFDMNTEVIVNPVNCVGIMGKGLALQFKKKYPQNMEFYKNHCNNCNYRLGKILVFPLQKDNNPKYIFNFPTKYDWRDKSDLEGIQLGLQDLVSWILYLEIKSIAIPALGCGLGGLPWPEVKSLCKRTLGRSKKLAHVDIIIIEPYV